MAKFSGKIGYATESVEIRKGVWKDEIVERQHFGDVIRNTRQLTEGESVNDDLSVSNSISIVADAYAREHFFAMRYIMWAGTLWTIKDVEVQSPRLLLRLGGVYHGPKAVVPGTP